MSDYTLLDLFRQEVEAQVAILKQRFMTLKQQPESVFDRQDSLQALHAIAGIAQMVEVEAAVTLTEAMRSKLEGQALDEATIDQLLQASDWLIEISQLNETDRERWLFAHVPEIDVIQERSVDRDKQLITEVSEENLVKETVAPLPIVDAQIMDLFRLEVEEQAKILNEGLLALEAEPNATQPLEALMRAAHSIKGAARIVGLDAAVNLAHEMEDCFVAAQNRTLSLNPDLIDGLLRGVDLLQNLSQVSDRDLPDWLASHNLDLNSVRSLIDNRRNPGSEPSPQSIAVRSNGATPVQPAPVAIVPPPPDDPPPVESATRDRVVRVSADNLNRMMGLAGESLIEANALPTLADALMQVRSQQIELAKSLETLEQQTLSNPTVDRSLVDTIRRQEQHCRNLLSDRVTDLEEFIRRTTNLSDRLYREVISSHMRPFEEGVQSFSRMVRDLARSLDKQARLEIIGKSTSVDRDILMKLEAPITHILRNAIDHGIETPAERMAAGKPAEGRIRLEAAHRGGMLAITIADDGSGIDVQKLRQRVVQKQLVTSDLAAKLTDAELMEFLFLPGFSLSNQVTEISGRGVGLDIAKSMAQEVGGTVRVASRPGKGTTFYFQLPLTLSVVRTLLVEVSGEAYAFPLSRIDRIITIQASDISVVENRQYVTIDHENIGLIPLYQVLDLPASNSPPDPLWIVILSDQSNTYGLIVDRCLGERELVVRPLDPRLGKVQDISAAALMPNGSLVLILDVSDLVRSLNSLIGKERLAKMGEVRSPKAENAQRVLVVDDSITVREMERKLLQNRGYLVDVAVDGMEGWNAVRSYPYDLVITDIDMPRMNGIELIKEMKRHSRFQSIPVIVVSYRDREDDRIQGLEAGADYYLTKNSFHDDTLIRAVVDLIGE